MKARKGRVQSVEKSYVWDIDRLQEEREKENYKKGKKQWEERYRSRPTVNRLDATKCLGGKETA